jgi:NAD(P)H-hydrate epimerase
MRALDRATIDDIGIPALALMETAGRAVAAAARAMLGEARGPVAVVCGPGNNGGDGFVCTRVLRDAGLDAIAYLAAPRAKIAGSALAHLEILERAGGLVRSIESPRALADVAGELDRAALVVDALFGIGAVRAIEGHLADVVAAINRGARRLAVDVPSGLDADTGVAAGAAVIADRTVTMAALKICLVGAPGFARAGQVEVAEIGVPAGVLATQVVRAALVEAADVARWWPRAAAMDHKGTRGHVLVLGGMPGMRGAGRLAASAALRAGAGLVTLAATGDVTAEDSVMTRSIDRDSLGEAIAGKAAIVIGPGLGQSEAAATWLGEVLAAGVPAVLDADALQLLAGIVTAAQRATAPLVLTPHPGEAARLLGTTIAEVEADRMAAARTLAARTHAVVVLKGARTIVCDGIAGDELCTINPTGGPELATGGSGDVLAGVIGALLAQGVAPADAARAAVYVHGLAGAKLAAELGSRGAVSSDLPRAIARVAAEIPRPR